MLRVEASRGGKMEEDVHAARAPTRTALARFAIRRPLAIVAAATLCVLAPSLIFGVGRTHDFFVHYLWAREFADVALSGEVYPRWLPGIGDGLGSPAFYFYPPLAYYVCALVELVTLHALPTQHVIAFAAALFLFGSGAAMFAWLRKFAAAGPALLGAVGYVIAPYHLFVDHYLRGAFGEFATFMFLPLIALGLHDVWARGRWGVAKLALAYAGLIYCHVTTTLLVSLFLIAPYALFLAATSKQRIRFILSALFAGLCALALAAPTWLPAITLQHYISPEKWDLYTTLNFLPILPHRWTDREMMLLYTGGGLGWLVLMGGVTWTAFRQNERSAHLLFWSLLGLSCALLVLGLPFPGFWTLPIIERVQFSWRLNTVLEFAAITALVLAAHAWRSVWSARVVQAGAALALIGAFACGAMAARNVVAHIRHGQDTIAAAQAPQFDAPEYLPAGFWDNGNPFLEAIAQPPLSAYAGTPRLVELSDDLIRIEADPLISGPVVVRRFYFPAWVVVRARDGAPIAAHPSERFRFISFTAEAGERYVIRRALLPVERLAWLIAAIAAAVLCLVIALSLVGARRARLMPAHEAT